jgi:pilus assembly protein Flp/PilA
VKTAKIIAMSNCFKRLLRDTRGTSAVEYGLICAMIIVGLIAAIQGLANQTETMWNGVSQKSADAIAGN